MPTNTLKKLKHKHNNTPSMVAAKARKVGTYVMLFFGVTSSVALLLLLLKIWVPGLAWLE